MRAAINQTNARVQAVHRKGDVTTMPGKLKVSYEGKQVDADDVGFRTLKEDWNEYQTEDGTLVRMKLVVSNIARIPGAQDNAGNPIYVIKSSNVVGIAKVEDLGAGPGRVH